ncbi:sugar phosphate isomerase/epimerase family protein [Paenibacillus taichungensis]
MKLSISNIAWDADDEEAIIELLQNAGVEGIEIAPTKFWGNPVAVPIVEIDTVKTRWRSAGVRFIAMQSLLFGQNQLGLFTNQQSRIEMVQYLTRIMELAGQLEVQSLVFGSPKNRLAGSLTKKEQMGIAVPFFHELAEIAMRNNVTMCIEPNPAEYACDFITNSDEGMLLVKEVNHPGFRLHLDAGALSINRENIPVVIEQSIPYLNHFHISEPYLNLIGAGNTQHKIISEELRQNGYSKWVSIEMKNNLNEFSNIENVKNSLNYALEIYSS